MTRDEFNGIKSQSFFRGKVITDSMSPLIKVGDEIIVDVGNSDLKRFDIVVFFWQDRLICHYLWSINKVVKPILFQTRSLPGGRDVPLKLEDYLGKVINFKLNWWQKLRALI